MELHLSQLANVFLYHHLPTTKYISFCILRTHIFNPKNFLTQLSKERYVFGEVILIISCCFALLKVFFTTFWKVQYIMYYFPSRNLLSKQNEFNNTIFCSKVLEAFYTIFLLVFRK